MQRLQGQGFGQVVIHARHQTLLTITGHGIGREGNNWQARITHRRTLSANCTCGLQAIHVWHLHIHQHQAVIFLLQGFQGFKSVCGKIDAQTELLQQGGGDLLIDQIVFRQQQSRRAEDRQWGGFATGMTRENRFLSLLRGQILGHHQREQTLQILVIQGFTQIPRKADIGKVIGIARRRQGGQHDHAQLAKTRVSTHAPPKFGPIHLRHLHINQGQGKGVFILHRLFQQSESRRAIFSFDRTHLPFVQANFKNFAIGRIIVHNQHPQPIHGGKVCCRSRRLLFRLLALKAGRKPKFRTIRQGTRSNLAVHQFGQLLGNCQSQPGAAIFARG